jgi:hypothetical protein
LTEFEAVYSVNRAVLEKETPTFRKSFDASNLIAHEKKGRYQSGQLGLTVTQLTYVFVGSNPALPTEAQKANA